jgi:hypothetical protein
VWSRGRQGVSRRDGPVEAHTISDAPAAGHAPARIRLLITADAGGSDGYGGGVQAGRADLVEPVDHVTDGVLVGVHQLDDQGCP